MKLDGKVAVVTGAGRGIGRSVALKLADEGACLVINDLDPEVAEDAAAAVRKRGGSAIICAGNVTHPQFGEKLVEAACAEYGGIDVLINNAGYTWDGVIQKTTDEQWYAMVDCHVTAPFRILRAVQPVFKELFENDRRNGIRQVRKVVNISSITGMFGNIGQSGYSAAKAGIGGLTKTLAKEWGRIGVTVNSVAFGFISTRLTSDVEWGDVIKIEGEEIRIGVNSDLMRRLEGSIPLGRCGTTDEAAGAIYLMCIPESDYVSGQTLLCSGGLTGI